MGIYSQYINSKLYLQTNSSKKTFLLENLVQLYINAFSY